jgi:hypothetical protein
MNHQENINSIINKTHLMLDDPQSLWQRVFPSSPFQSTILTQNARFESTLFLLTINFEVEAPLKMNVQLSLTNAYSKKVNFYHQARVNDVDFFMKCIKEFCEEQTVQALFQPHALWTNLTIKDLQTLVVPRIKLLKHQVRTLPAQSPEVVQANLDLDLIKHKLTLLADPLAQEYAQLVEYLET